MVRRQKGVKGMIDQMCETLEYIIPDIRWDDEGVCAIRQAVQLLKEYKKRYGELHIETGEERAKE